ncbi:hypothetical protein QYZ44_17080 [Vibrio parahaemolyticus]|nr:hypothetical protein [Vibrio parahaemolyticus]MDN4695701.1 hypothetical protein [Vibrio parahaemolyticus]MDN4710919.1 hypothetical protein [Vibrio parahaemolyticus]MDN4710927.1 hypothetical protein [Vibrio parahaemolyticus]MDN4735348.1 hypothetical protein [Vibrio parahaemolyticus]
MTLQYDDDVYGVIDEALLDGSVFEKPLSDQELIQKFNQYTAGRDDNQRLLVLTRIELHNRGLFEHNGAWEQMSVENAFPPVSSAY